MIKAGSTLLLATRNSGKTREFREAFNPLGIKVIDLHEVEGVPDIEETGLTFEDNAYIKARAAAEAVQLPVLADDSGLCVDLLGGAPGVFSARYAGEHASDADNNHKLLKELSLIAKNGSSPEELMPGCLSTARFVCSLVLYDPADGSRLHAEGTVEGLILSEARGTAGFGYDPLFWLPVYRRTMAELTLDEKIKISHRGTALRHLLTLMN